MTLLAFKEAFQATLKGLKTEKEQACEAFAKDMREDEAKFARIELNIIDIFEKMFTASLAKVVNVDETNWRMPLKTAYLGFFQKIPAGWHENLAKCEQFEMHEEAHIERVKIAQADLIKALFLEGGRFDD